MADWMLRIARDVVSRMPLGHRSCHHEARVELVVEAMRKARDVMEIVQDVQREVIEARIKDYYDNLPTPAVPVAPEAAPEPSPRHRHRLDKPWNADNRPEQRSGKDRRQGDNGTFGTWEGGSSDAPNTER